MLMPYRPEPYVNFAEAEPRQKILAALKDVRSQLGRTYPLRIGDKCIETDKKISSVMPGQNETVVGYVSKASQDHAEEAVRIASARRSRPGAAWTLRRGRACCSRRPRLCAGGSTS